MIDSVSKRHMHHVTYGIMSPMWPLSQKYLFLEYGWVQLLHKQIFGLNFTIMNISKHVKVATICMLLVLLVTKMNFGYTMVTLCSVSDWSWSWRGTNGRGTRENERWGSGKSGRWNYARKWSTTWKWNLQVYMPCSNCELSVQICIKSHT